MDNLLPDRFPLEETNIRGFKQVFIRCGVGGVPLLLVHGWPETKRIWWRVIDELVAAGFEVIAPDLRGFGDSELGPDGFNDISSHAGDLYALAHDHLGHERIVVAGGDLGGPVIQELSTALPEWVDRMILFNSPLPFLREKMEGLRTRPEAAALDYFIRQGTDADSLIAELSTPDLRAEYISAFYSSRLWAYPGAFNETATAFMVEPFRDELHLRASFGAYESVFDSSKRSGPALFANQENPTRTLVLFGEADHVISPDFDLISEIVFANRVGPINIPACGHFVQWEAHALLTAQIIEFCSDLLNQKS